MKRFIFLALLPLLAMACNNQGNDVPVREASIVFDIESVASPDNLVVYYSSSDPGCGLPKSYSIFAGFEPNELVMKCTNLDKIVLTWAMEYTYSTATGEQTESTASIVNSSFSFENSACSMEVVDDNLLKITLKEMAPEMMPDNAMIFNSIRFMVADFANPNKVKEEIVFHRTPEFHKD